jgi:hypothetical protein
MPIDDELDSAAGKELGADIVPGRAYLLMIGGREHNVCISSVGPRYIFGHVAINKTLLLIDKKGAGNSVARLVLPQDEKGAIAPGDELFHSLPVVTRSESLKIRVRLDAIDVVEDHWRPFLDNETVSPEGKVIDDERLLATLPALASYYVKGRGFVRNPDVWLGVPPPPVELHLAPKGNSSSE